MTASAAAIVDNRPKLPYSGLMIPRPATLFSTCAAFVTMGVMPGTALAQAQGVYPATIACDALGTGGRERSSFQLRLAGGQASYSVRLGSRGLETGSGVLSGRRLSLTGSLGGASGHTARYSGEITGRGGLLTGTQTPAGGGKGRGCQIILGDG